MKRILFARRTYGFGGTEVILLDWLKRIDYSAYDVFVCSPRDVFSKAVSDAGLPAKIVHLSEEEILRIYGRYRPAEGIIDLVQGSFWHYFPIWLGFLKSLKPDEVVFLDGDFFTTPLACVLAAYVVTKGNVSMTIHSPAKLEPPLQKKTKIRFGFLPDFGLWWYPRVSWPLWPWKLRARLSKRILMASSSIKSRIERFYGYPKAKTGLVGHGVDTGAFRPSLLKRRRYRRQNEIPDDAFVIVSTSRLSAEKRVERVIKAFEEIARKDERVWLLLAGDGPLKTDVENSIAKCESRERIKLIGHVDDVAPVLQAADAYVLPSEFEARTIALAEAMAVGLICLASNIPGPDEMIEDGHDGFLIDPSTSGVVAGLQKVLALPASERDKVSANARKKVEDKFELENAVQDAFAKLEIASPEHRQRALQYLRERKSQA